MNGDMVSRLKSQFVTMLQEKLADGMMEDIADGFDKHLKLNGDNKAFSISFTFKLAGNQGNISMFAPSVGWKVTESYKNAVTWSVSLDDKQQMLPGMEPVRMWHPTDEPKDSPLWKRWEALMAAAVSMQRTLIFSCPECGDKLVHKYDGHWSSFYVDNPTGIVTLGNAYYCLALRYSNGDLWLTDLAEDALDGQGCKLKTWNKWEENDWLDNGGLFRNGYLPRKEEI